MAKVVLRPIEIINEFSAFLGQVLQQGIEFIAFKLASQAERAGSIPATRSSKCFRHFFQRL